MKTKLGATIIPILQTFSLAVTVGLATPARIFAQPVTTFTKITTGHIATNLSSSFGAAWGDYNNDGFEDLFVANVGGRNDSLYLNNTNGTFTPILTGEIVNDGKQSFCANWGDYDNDGHLDLFVTIRGFPETNRLYRNAGNGTFTKATSGDVVTDSHNGFMFGSGWGDYDNDGFLDLVVAKTGGGIDAGKRDPLYRNDGAGGFNRILTGPIVQVSDVSGGCAWGDYNNDGKLDLFVVNTTTNFLFRNDGNGTFTQPSHRKGSQTLDFIDEREAYWTKRPLAPSHRIGNRQKAHVFSIFHKIPMGWLWNIYTNHHRRHHH